MSISGERSDYRKQLGKRLKMVRLENDLKQEDISRIFGISKGSVSEYENGKNEPPLRFLMNFARNFKVNPVWLFEGGDVSRHADFPTPLKVQDTILKSYKNEDQVLREIVDYLKTDRDLLETVWHLVEAKKGIRNLKRPSPRQ